MTSRTVVVNAKGVGVGGGRSGGGEGGVGRTSFREYTLKEINSQTD